MLVGVSLRVEVMSLQLVYGESRSVVVRNRVHVYSPS